MLAADRLSWEQRFSTARAAFDQSRYAEALEQYRGALAEAEQTGADPPIRGRLHNGVGLCLLALSDYRGALAQFLAALPLVAADAERQSLVQTNIASLYFLQGDRENALRLYRQALESLGGTKATGRAAIRSPLLANLGAVERRRGRYRQALAYEEAALREAPPGIEPERLAGIYDLLGLTRLDLREYAAARAAFQKSLELRQPGGDPARSWMFLGRVELAAGRLPSAVEMLSAAVSRASRNERTLWQTLYWRADAYRRLQKHKEAWQDLSRSAALLESFRAHVIPTDGLRVQFEVEHAEVFAAWAELSCERTDAGALAAGQAFHAVESGRAYSLRALLASRPPSPGGSAPTLWQQYQAQLRRLESRGPAGVSGDVARELQRAEEEASFRELEARLQVEEPALASGLLAPALNLEQTQAVLGEQDLLLSFYVRPQATWLWAVTLRQTRFYRLPAPAGWTGGARRFVAALREGSDARAPGRDLYRALLGAVEPALLARSHWIVAADGDAALLPFAALPAPSGRYLIEEHALSYAPAASVLPALRGRTGQEYARDFLALADPIVNRADPRRPAAGRASSEVGLPRLAASAGEAEACARLFGAARSMVLTGARASERDLRRQGAAGYRYWHLTSHVVVDPERPNTSYVALSLPDKLTVLDVLGLPAQAEMITLNGCESGGGKLLPGTGVLGFTRAFLAAGAASVLATHWQIPDESGALVRAVYRNLGPAGDCRAGRGEALRQAQLEMLRSGGWRAEPRYWAAYFLSGWGGADRCPDTTRIGKAVPDR